MIVGIIRLEIVVSGNCMGGNCSRWKLFEWELYMVGIVRVGRFSFATNFTRLNVLGWQRSYRSGVVLVSYTRLPKFSQDKYRVGWLSVQGVWYYCGLCKKCPDGIYSRMVNILWHLSEVPSSNRSVIIRIDRLRRCQLSIGITNFSYSLMF